MQSRNVKLTKVLSTSRESATNGTWGSLTCPSPRGSGTTQEGAERLQELEVGEGLSKAAFSGVGRTTVLMNSKQLQLMAQDEVSQWCSTEWEGLVSLHP